MSDRPEPLPLTVRTSVRPEDVEVIVQLHGAIYAREYGFDRTFEEYVDGPLRELVARNSPRERVWIAERARTVVGCIGIAQHSAEVAQIRWYVVSPECRGRGLGTRLLTEAVRFCRANGYERVLLWTVSALVGAARLYRAAGFRIVEELPGVRWGVPVVEQRYEIDLKDAW